MFKLYDYINVAPDEKISSLKKEEKIELVDSIVNSKKSRKGFIYYLRSFSQWKKN